MSETQKSYEPYEYVADDYYKLDQTLSELKVDSNVAGFGAETDAAESSPIVAERSQEVTYRFSVIFCPWSKLDCI